MTINKSQGQSVKNVGINFQTPVFPHVQFYVAMSQGTLSHLPSIAPPWTTACYVYQVQLEVPSAAQPLFASISRCGVLETA